MSQIGNYTSSLNKIGIQGRFCELNNIPEVKDLEAGMDFREPQYRREVFLRFYEYHTQTGSHPGAVYYAFPNIFTRFGMTQEEKLLFCFINGVCQNVVTTVEIFSKFSTLDSLAGDDFAPWFRQHYTKFGWDTDRRYTKNNFESIIAHYHTLVTKNGRTQEQYFNEICKTPNKYANFDLLWAEVMSNFHMFGRLSTFSYLEYLRIAGVNIDCSNLFLEDLSGSKSHRNGLLKVLGRDDLIWDEKMNPGREQAAAEYGQGLYTKDEIEWLKREGSSLLQEATTRFAGATYFTLESTLCCYKSWHKKNRRYPNCYNDMFYERILANERAWGKENTFFRKLRQECLPKHLRVEDNMMDPGLKPEKQNHYLITGQVIMMDKEWPCFENDFNKRIGN